MMIDLLSLHKQFIAPHMRPGVNAADFTMGNGHDTLWLAREVGEKGHVWAFDIQQAAVESTRALLEKELDYCNYTLIHDSHANAKEHITEPISVGMFNLGWLPGAPREVTTKRTSTLPAVQAAIELLAPDGIIVVAVYPGHEEGTLEGEALDEMLSGYSRFRYCVSKFRIINSPASPFFFIIESK